MRHNYINLNQNASKNDGQVPRNVQMSRYCPQPDSVSNPCRCRDLATPRVFSAVLSARAWKHVAMIFAVLVMSMANVGVAWGQGVSYVCGFENGTDSWSKSSMGTLVSQTTEVRTGSKSLECPCSNANGYARKSVSYTKGYYIHLILWAKSSANTSATTKMYSTQGSTTDITTSGWTRMTQSYNYTSSTANRNTDVLPKMASGKFFIDDVIVYYSSSSTTDINEPSLATSASATTSSISWTNGSDTGEGATGIQATLIFHRTGGSVGGNDLTLNDQGLYSLTVTEGPKVVGNWTLLSASVDAAATSYSGTFEAGDEYAIVHRDLAYNYSAPTYVTVPAAPACGETAQAALTLSSNSGTICGTGTTTFTVSGGSGTGALSVSSSDPSKATASIDGTTVTVTGVAAGSATITVTKACDATYAEATADYSVTVNSVPTANAGADKTTEPGEGVALAATAAADGCTGAWTIVSGPNTATGQLGSTSSAKATFTPTVAGTYTLRWTVTNTSSSCSAYDEMTVSAAVCSISECGNATITYAINGGSSGDHSEGGADLISSATASNTTALGASTTVGYTGISMSSLAKKAAAATSACYPTKPNMSGKIGVYNGAAYNSSNYLQFAFTVKTGYTFTPCDIEFTVQPVDVATNFCWEVTDGTNVYGYGTATDVLKGSDGGASVLTGLTSTAEMAAGTYYIRLYPYVNAASKTFRISNDVILKGTTASATPSCTAPTNVAISGEYVHFPGETLTLTVSGDNIAQDATYTWKKGDQVIAGQTTATLTINSCEITDAGNYTCTISNGGSCEATANYTVKMYSLRGLTDNNWTTDFVFTKVNATTATYSMELTGSSSYDFKVYDGSAYYGNTGGNPTMTSDNCTNWTMQENMGNNVTLQTTAAGTYTFTLNYTNASNPTISVTYPQKKMVYFNPNMWADGATEVYTVYSWQEGSNGSFVTMTSVEGCGNTNIYQAEIDASHNKLLFIRWNQAHTAWDNNRWNQSIDLDYQTNGQYKIDDWGNNSDLYWKDGAKKSWASHEKTFTPNYIVTFDANGHGTAPDAKCVAKNGKATTPAAPTATGYTFGGWYKEAGCINAWNFANDVVTENITLYAKWTANNYTITYNENRPTNAWNAAFAVKNIPAEQTLTGGTGTVSNNTPTITEDESSEYAIYTFNNWNTAADGKGTSYAAGAAITITENTTLYAQWTPRTYTITYYDTDKTTVLDLEPKNYIYGTGVASLPTPTKDGYTFSSWTKWWDGGEESNVSSISNTTWGDANLTAQWTCAALTLVLDGDAATPAGGSPIGTEYTLICSASTGAIASYQWKQNTTASTTGAVDAEGTGATTASFSPVPAAAGTYYYYCVATDACDNSVNTSFSGAFTFTAPVVPYATSIDFEAIIDESGTGAAWKTTMEGRNYMLTQADGSKWSLDDGDSGNKPADKGLKIKETGDNAGKITFTVRANQTVELKVGTLAGTGSGVAKFSTDGGSSYSNITGAATASTGVSVVTTYTGATDRTYVFKTNSASWNILQHIIIGYKITYDKGANGTGTIDPMYKTHGTNINLSSSTFTYAGHTQDGWSTSDGGSKVYELGASYTSDAPITLYPHWVEEVVVPSITATKTSPDYVTTDPNNVVLSISTTGASSGWYYRVKNTGTADYQTPDNTPYNTATWTMTSGLALGENNFVVELYNGSGVKQAESGTITVTAEKAYPITIAAGAGGSVSPSGEIKANESGNHIHPAITATPNSGYHFVNWTYSNSNATVADASSASTTVNDARGACTITANFEADAPVATPMITYNLNVDTSASASIGTSGTSTDPSNITSIAISQANAAGDGAGASNRTTKLPLATGENAASVDNPDKYVLFTFNVACGKKLTPSEVKIKVANVGSSAGGNQNYKAVLSDAYGHSISNTFTGTKGDGTVEEFSITNGGGTYFQGDVTLKLWSCKGASGNASAFRMGTPLTIYGVIGDEATPAATITWNTQPADGQVGSDDFAYAVSCSDDSDVTVTSADPSIATIVDGKLHYEAAGTTHLVATATDACGNTITQNSNEFTVTAASVDPDPGTGEEKYYYAQAAISNGSLVKGMSNAIIQFFTVTGGVVANSTALSISSTPSAASIYYNSNNLTHEELSKSSNWGSSSTANRYIQGMKFKDATTYTLELGSKTATSIRFYGWCGSSSRKLTIGGVEYTSSSTQNTFFAKDFTKPGNFTGEVSIVCGGDFYGIIVIDITSLPSCTTPELSNLENKIVCPGEDVSWTASNTEALQDGETIAYQWTKKGNATILSPTATLTLNDVTEATGGTYVVTAIVSADGKASKTASKEVTLTVTPATATPTITANANTIYTGNDVTLTATCASSGVGYQWYTCTDADGNGESEIGGATNATYTLTAGEAGTYYYKVIVTGDGTHSCGTAEKVYTLIVSASNSGETTCGDITGQFTNGAYIFDKDFIIYGINSGGNHNTGASASSGNNRCGEKGYYLSGQRFVVIFPVEVSSFSFIGYQSNLRTVEAVKTTTDLKTADTEYTTITHTVEPSQEGNCQTHVITPETAIPANTFVWVELNNGLNLSEICYVPVSNVNCTDPQVIATVDNATVCEDTENVTFTATNYADGATLQWQKKNGNAWGNIGAPSATYTISPVTTEHAGQYRVIATKEECSRTSEELTLTVLTAPEFNAFANTASVMKGNALTINDVEATNATDYTWYKSADNSFDVEADTKVGTTKELLLAASSITEEADQTFYLFCVASNSCGSVTSNAITVTVTPFVEEECATAGNESNDHEFGFVNTDCSLDTYGDSKTPVWKTSSRSKYLTYTAPEGKYFATAKVTVAHTGGTKCGYAYSTNGGTTWVVAELGGLSATLTAITIELSANVNAFRISRNLTAQDGEKGSASGYFYLAEACFTYENACTPTSVTPTTTSYEYNISTPADFEEPPFTVKHGEDIVNDAVLTYTSSNPAIATVDEEGSVTFEGMTGTVTITAAYAGTTIDEIEYCASEGSYTITVVCQDEEPKIIAATSTNLDGCNNSITLEAKMQDGNSFTGGTFQWYRDGEAIDGATSASYEVVRAGTYTVSRTYTCTTMSSKPAVVTNENPEPKVERLTPFQYYHVDKDYSDQMKDRHLFAVTSYGTLDGKRYHLTATRNGEALDLSSSTAFFTISSSDNAVDTVMIDLNELKGKYSANDKIVITCAPIDNCNQVSTITSSITIHVIGQTPTLALICSGSSKAGGTRKTGELTEGGDFLTGYNVADLCQQTGNQTFDPNTEWGFYTELKEDYIVTPVNGYAQFNKLNYEPFDILLLTDYPKSSKSEAAQKIIDDMAELCDYRPLLSFKTHFQSDKWKDKTTGEYKYTKWVKKGFTTAPVVPKQSATYVNIVCYAHPMFKDIDNINDGYTFHDDDDPNQLVYQVLTGPGYEGDKGIQGFELADADNFVTIGLVHYNAIADTVKHDDHTHIRWSAEANDRLLVAMAERQTNIEARMMLFSLNCGAQSLQTEGGRRVILQCLKYLLETDPLEVADCRMTFDNGAGNTDFDLGNYEGTGTKGDGLWSTAANWGPDYLVVPGRNNDVRIAAPCIVDGVKTKVSVGNEVQETIQYYPEVLSIHITENGSLTIPANSSLTARSTILRADENGNVYPTNVADISLGSNAGGNASLILNNERGDTKAGVAMYSTAKADTDTYSAAASTWQYIGTPHSDVANAIYNYYDSWLYQYDTGTEGWVVIPNGGPLVPFRGYCVTHPESPHTYWMEGTLVSTTNQDISIPANRFVVVANSWTAPIQINELTDDDMEGLTDKTIYFFNTGSDPNQEGELNKENGRYAAGTYVSVPIRSAPYTGDSVIPSMQGFYVVGGDADGTLHLDYERHVRAKRENVPSGPMHAPARIADTDNEPQVAKFLFRGTRYDDRLIILERPDFTRGYDSGWDGEQWGGNAAAPMSYVVTETRWDAVSAIPEYEGTVIAFRAGEDSEYTIHFDYDGMEEALYLLDTETKIYTRVLKGNSYTFTCTDKAEHNRFILTRKAPQIATGVGNVSGDEVQGTKAKKLLIEDKMFIMVNGVLYDATGKVVK